MSQHIECPHPLQGALLDGAKQIISIIAAAGAQSCAPAWVRWAYLYFIFCISYSFVKITSLVGTLALTPKVKDFFF